MLLASVTLVVLAACSNVSPVPELSDTTEFSAVASIDVSADMSQAEVEAIYGGTAFVFQPEAGFAILGFSEEQAALTTLSADPNQDAFTAPVSAVGFDSWAGGHGAWSGGHGAWSGGWDAWAGGWDAWAGGHDAWSGGHGAWSGGETTVPALPGENRFIWSQIKLPQAHALSQNFGEGMKVAVIDTGLDLNHAMFAGRLAPSSEWKDFIDGDNYPQEVSGGNAYGHGTAVAGIILQIAPRASILPIRAMSPDGSGDTDDIVSAISWAVQKNARIINLSLGTDIDVSALKMVVDYANNMGIYVVASAGNEGNSSTLTYPAAYATIATKAQYLISVGSSNSGSNMSAFSNRGAALEIAAPGERIYSAYPGNKVGYVTGTSFAAPQVAGALALGAMDAPMSNTAAMESHLLDHTWSMSGGFKHMSMSKLMQASTNFQANRQALFVVGNITLNSAESTLRERIRWNLGYGVTVKSAASVTTADADGMDVVIISSTVNSGDVNTKFRNVAVPVVTWESYLFDDLGMVSAQSGNYGTISGQTKVTMTTEPHPLAAGLHGYASYEQNVFGAPGDMSWGKPASSATVIATLASDSSKATIFAYDKGDQMVGMSAPARRVALMFHNSSDVYFWSSQWFFESAVTWVVTGN